MRKEFNAFLMGATAYLLVILCLFTLLLLTSCAQITGEAPTSRQAGSDKIRECAAMGKQAHLKFRGNTEEGGPIIDSWCAPIQPTRSK